MNGTVGKENTALSDELHVENFKHLRRALCPCAKLHCESIMQLSSNNGPSLLQDSAKIAVVTAGMQLN
eukprot:1225096-Karenia_brevis.AAC.1